MDQDTKSAFAVASLILLCSMMGWFVFQGPNRTFDDSLYLHEAHAILMHQFSPFESPYAYGYVLPDTIALALQLHLPVWLPAMLEYITLIILIYLIALRTTKSSLIAYSTSLIALTSAFIAGYSSRILPDMLTGVIAAAGIYLILDNTRRSSLLAGIWFGMLIFIKLSAVSIALPLLIALLIYKRPALPFFFGLALMVTVYFATMGFDFGIIGQYDHNQLALDLSSPMGNFLTVVIYLVPFLFYKGMGGVYWQVFPLGLLFTFALIGIYLTYLKKEKAYSPWSFVLIAGFLYMMFGTESLGYYETITVVSRYFIILAPVMGILCARLLKGIFDLVRYRYSLRQAYVVLAVLVLASVLLNLPTLLFFHGAVQNYIDAPLVNAT